MRMPDADPRWIAVTCATDGALRELLHDDCSLAPCFEAGRPLPSLFDPGSHRKVLDLISRLTLHAAVVEVELVTRCGERTCALCFAAVRTGDELLLVAAPGRAALQALCARLGQGDERHARQYATLMDHVPETHADSGTDTVWEDFTRMYHDFARLQRQVVRQNAELRRLGDEKDRMMRTVAHDLRGPLSAIRYTAEYLGRSLAGRASIRERESVERIKEVTGRMARLLDELLESDRSAVVAARPDLRRRPVALADLVTGTVQLCEPMAERKGIAFALRADASLPPVAVDPDHVQQILLNLIDNALKFSPAGTMVAVTLEGSAQEALVSVSDQGPGIRPEERERVFEPHFRGAAQPTGGEPSTGLGLAICRSLVEAHGGRIWVESAGEPGCVVRFALPLRVASAERSATSMPPDSPPSPPPSSRHPAPESGR